MNARLKFQYKCRSCGQFFLVAAGLPTNLLTPIQAAAAYLTDGEAGVQAFDSAFRERAVHAQCPGTGVGIADFTGIFPPDTEG